MVGCGKKYIGANRGPIAGLTCGIEYASLGPLLNLKTVFTSSVFGQKLVLVHVPSAKMSHVFFGDNFELSFPHVRGRSR